MRRELLCAAFCVMAISTMACSGQKEVKSPDDVKYDAGASASANGQAAPVPKNGADASTPAQPPAPDAQPPSAQPPTVEVVVDGVTRPVQDGERLAIGCQRMLFFYSAAAAPDCSNVKVSSLVARPMAGLCQVGFLPLEQGFKPGSETDASITFMTNGGATATRTFRVAVLPE